MIYLPTFSRVFVIVNVGNKNGTYGNPFLPTPEHLVIHPVDFHLFDPRSADNSFAVEIKVAWPMENPMMDFSWDWSMVVSGFFQKGGR